MDKNAVSREIVSADMHAPARDHAHLILRAAVFPDSRLVNGLGEYRELVGHRIHFFMERDSHDAATPPV